MGTRKVLFDPVRIGTMEVKNRFANCPMVTNYCDSEGRVTERFRAYWEERAKGGVGLLIQEATFVHPSGKGFSNEAGIHKDCLVDGLREVTDTVHHHGAKIGIQLYHGGRQTHRAVTGMPLLAPSAIPCPVCSEEPEAMSRAQIDEIVESFGTAAARAKRAGYDTIEIHGAHGYLLNQFLSPYSNHREDDYGGSTENRYRFPLEVYRRVREAVGDDYPIIYRISSEEFVPDGLTLEDTAAFCSRLADEGVDAIHVTGGVYASAAMIIQPAAISQGIYADNAARIREAVGARVPVIAVGRIKTPAMAEEIVAGGKADMVALGRALLADPHFVNKVAAGREEEIRHCIACNQGCIDRLFEDVDIACLGNPLTGHEHEFDLSRPAPKARQVLVIGGGPAGMEAARVAALRGHTVTLLEEEDQLGGQARIAALPPHKEEIGELLDFLKGELRRLDVAVYTSDPVTVDRVRAFDPDKVVVATGATPAVPDIPGLDGMHTLTAEEVLKGANPGRRVAVLGGGLVGSETAEYLADEGCQVTVLEMLPEIARDMGLLTRALLLPRLEEKGVRLCPDTKVTGAGDGALQVVCGGREQTIPDVDTVVLAAGYERNDTLAGALRDAGYTVETIGDCAEPRKMLEAIAEGFEHAYSL